MPLKVTTFLVNNRGALGILLIVKVLFAVVIYFELSRTKLHENQNQTSSSATVVFEATTISANVSVEETETIGNYCDILIRKSNWSSQSTNVDSAKRLELPITKLYVTETLTRNCFDYEQCKELAKFEQRLSKTYAHYPDIQYNFVIGGDGLIYEGLSWNYSVAAWEMPDAKSILVSLTGHARIKLKDVYQTNEAQYSALRLFITANLINGNLSPTYQLLPSCCVSGGKPNNPSKWVYTNLLLFENFRGDECIKTDKCKYGK